MLYRGKSITFGTVYTEVDVFFGHQGAGSLINTVYGQRGARSEPRGRNFYQYTSVLGMSTIINGGASISNRFDIEPIRYRTNKKTFRAVCVPIERRMVPLTLHYITFTFTFTRLHLFINNKMASVSIAVILSMER